jgi:hypothetical protein
MSNPYAGPGMTLDNMRSLGVPSLDVTCQCGREVIVDASHLSGFTEVAMLGVNLPVSASLSSIRKQAQKVSDLQACGHHLKLKKRTQQAVLAISEPHNENEEDECACEEENQNFAKAPEDCPKQDAQD